MEQEIQRRFEKYIRMFILVWILLLNTLLHVSGVQHTWLVFLGNIMFFIMEGSDLRKKLFSVLMGGFVGLCMSALLIKLLPSAQHLLGDLPGYVLMLALTIGPLILLHPRFPMVFNNVGFAYLTVSSIQAAEFIGNFPQYLITFLLGSFICTGVCLLLIKPALQLARQKSEKAAQN